MTLLISPRIPGTGASAPEHKRAQPPLPESIPPYGSTNFAGHPDPTGRTATANALGDAASLGAARGPRAPRFDPFGAANAMQATPMQPSRPILPLPNKLLQIAARYAPIGFHGLCKAPGFHNALLREHPDREWIAAGLSQAVDGLAAEPFNREARGMVEVFKKIDVALRLESGRARILAEPDTNQNSDAEQTRRAALRAHYLRFAGELDPILIAHEMAALDQLDGFSSLDKSIAIIDLARAGIGALSGEPLKRAQQTAKALQPEERAGLPEDVAQFSEILQRLGGASLPDLTEMHPLRRD